MDLASLCHRWEKEVSVPRLCCGCQHSRDGYLLLADYQQSTGRPGGTRHAQPGVLEGVSSKGGGVEIA